MTVSHRDTQRTTASMATPQRYNGPAKDGDWNNYRDTITTLYLEQNKSLKEVMRIMREEYYFFATEKMYKIRFNRWGLHKKLRAHQVAELLLQRGRRAAEGKPSVSYVHGRKVDPDRLNAYLRRVSPTSKKELVELLSGKLDSIDAQKRSIEDIVCRTPSPEPEPIPRRVAAPDNLRLPEECMQIVRSYVGGALDGSLWHLTPDKELIFPRRPRTWLDPVSSARQLFINGFTEQGFRMIRITFDDYKEVMSRQDPSLLVETCLALGALLQSGPGLAESLIDYACGLSRIVLGPRHPLHLLFIRFKGASPVEITRFVGLIIQGFLQTVQTDSRLKPTWLATVYRAMINSNFIELDTAQKYMQELIADLEGSPCPPVDLERDAIKKDINLLRHHLAWLTNVHNKPTEAAASARTLVETSKGKDPRLARFSCYNMLRTLPTSSEVSDEEAIDLMMQSLSICETEFGRNDNATVTLLATLQTFLRRVGRIEDAERVRADFEKRWDEVMDDMTRLKA